MRDSQCIAGRIIPSKTIPVFPTENMYTTHGPGLLAWIQPPARLPAQVSPNSGIMGIRPPHSKEGCCRFTLHSRFTPFRNIRKGIVRADSIAYLGLYNIPCTLSIAAQRSIRPYERYD